MSALQEEVMEVPAVSFKVTFAISVVLAWLLFHHVGSEWIVYGAYVFAISYYEMRRLRSMPVQAKVISQYISYLKDYVIERNVPSRQIEALKQIFIDMEQQLLPVTRPEFESRALLYHILMDLEDF